MFLLPFYFFRFSLQASCEAHQFTFEEDSGTLTFHYTNNISVIDCTFSSEYRSKTQKLIIEEGITEIKGSTSYFYATFYLFQQLTKVQLPTTLEIIGQNSFFRSVNIEEINFPKGLKSIGTSAFSSAGKIKSILLESIETISNNCFMSCTALKEVTITSNQLQTIGPNAFASCSNLTLFKYLSNNVPTAISDTAFGDSFQSNPTPLQNVTVLSNYPEYMFGPLPVNRLINLRVETARPVFVLKGKKYSMIYRMG